MITMFRFVTALVVLGVAAVVVAQTIPTCTVNTDSVTPSCPTSEGWIAGVTCGHRTVSCTTLNGVVQADIGITFGYKTPSSPTGTIVSLATPVGLRPTAIPVANSTTRTITTPTTFRWSRLNGTLIGKILDTV
jgi:hypothetical protein